MSTPPPASSSTDVATVNRPWREFLDISAVSLPISVSETTFRIKKNLYYFRSNYALITLIILFLTLIFHPISIIVFLFTFAAWLYLYLFRTEPIILFNWIVDDWVVLIFLYVITFGALILTKVWMNVFVSILIGGFVVGVHAALRAPEDVDDMESPYGPLLSVVDSPRGAYNRV